MPGFEKPKINTSVRLYFAFGFICLLFLVILLKLWHLQIINGDYFRHRSENNRLMTVFVPPPRGIILDRNGAIIAGNRPSFNIELVVEDSKNPAETLERLARVLDRDPEYLKSKLRDQQRRRKYEPKLILKDVSRDEVARVAARRFELPGIITNVAPTREYVQKEFASHVVGYIREISRDQLNSQLFAGYRIGDMIGQYGIENRWERYLQGSRGVQKVIVNAMQTRISELSYEPENPGHNVTLTLSSATQKAADNALLDKKGGIVAMDPRTGEILAMASSPGFDPNIFTRGISADDWRELMTGSGGNMSNRVVQGGYPPGSVFKIFMAVAAMAEGIVTPGERIHCPGHYRFGGRSYRCHRASGHGSVNYNEAMTQSCNVYFYTVGQRLGIDRIHDYASRFGLGQQTGLILAQENPGLIPSTAWKRENFRNPEDQRWYPGETLSVAIGQGAVVTTPLQITRAVSALVNGGLLMRPYLVKQITSNDGRVQDDSFGSEVVSELGIDPGILKTVIESLISVVNDPRGTARRAKLGKEFEFSVAGKTGTAQAVQLDRFAKGEGPADHAWFVGFAPAENPEIVVTALVENAGEGGGVASAPLVRQVLEAFFAEKYEIDLEKEEA